MYLVLLIYTLLPSFVIGYVVGRNASSKTANIVFLPLGFLATLFLLGVYYLGHLGGKGLVLSDVIQSVIGGILIFAELMGAKFIASFFKNKSK
jgi:hypothetical protein